MGECKIACIKKSPGLTANLLYLGLAARVDGSADICYCEAKHVQSFYASIARSEQDARDFDSYSGRVLILDEVDALVIDEEPNEPFVYPNQQPETQGKENESPKFEDCCYMLYILQSCCK
eukprot:symbB.v1.2.009660.t1/scaffold593.1/size185935/11